MPVWSLFDSFKISTIDGTCIDLDSDVIKVALLTSIVIPDITVHTHWKDLQVTEVSGANYAMRGNVLTMKTITETGGIIRYDIDDPKWTLNPSGFSNARYAIIYKDTGNNITSPLIATLDFGFDRNNIGHNLVLRIDQIGIFTIS